MTSVAVAVKSGAGVGRRRSKRAVRWAVENLLPEADTFILVYVMPTITSIPTPSGERIPIEEVDKNVVAMYVQEVKLKLQEDMFLSFKRLCNSKKVEALVLEDDDPATGLLRYVSQSGIHSLVLGSCSQCCLRRKRRGPGVPETVLKSAPGACDIRVVSKYRITSKSADSSLTGVTETSSQTFGQNDYMKGSICMSGQVAESYSSSVEPKVSKNLEAPSFPDSDLLDWQAFRHRESFMATFLNLERVEQDSGNSLLAVTSNRCDSTALIETDQSYVQAEIEQLRLELQNTVTLYKQACEDLVHTQNKVHLISSEFLEESGRVNAALVREETLRKIAAEQKERYVLAIKEAEEAKGLFAREAYGRQIAEMNALREVSEKQKLVDALFLSDKRYRRYTKEEIELATDFFSERSVIGEGGYGKVYKCSLDHTPVAVKVLLCVDAVSKKEEFLREVEVLSQLHHPHLLLLLGACPEIGCLVYEYLENGSLEECIFHLNGKPPLPWFDRFRIVFEVACGLAFLHNAKPEPVIHRDLKPGNILLDKNYASKIGDVGLAKLISDIVPDSITEYRDSMLAGTIHYMDPEYQRTGTVRPKSDLYAFGIIILQLLTARRPNGLTFIVENAITNGSFAGILDASVTDWPLAETEELAEIALKCSRLRCRDRPDLDTEVLPVLRKLFDVAAASVKVERSNAYAPNHYFCPILQEIMDDPYIAADGFTYEHRAIKAWLEKHNVSPVTKLRLQHSIVIPNHTLHSAIQEWRSRINFQVP